MCGALVHDGECVSVFKHWRLRRRISGLVEALVLERISNSNFRAIYCRLSLHGYSFSVVIALPSLRLLLHACVFNCRVLVVDPQSLHARAHRGVAAPLLAPLRDEVQQLPVWCACLACLVG